MADAKLTALAALSPILSTDIIYAVSDPGGTPVSKKVTVLQLFTSPRVTTSLLDTSGNPLVAITATGSAIFGLTLTNAASGGTVIVGVTTPTQAASGIAGTPLQIKASDAVAGASNAGAVAGGAVTITTGDAKRLTSGNAAGGNLNINLGSGIGTGTKGGVVITTNSATGLSIGAGGLTNPVVSVACDTASQDTGVLISGGVGATTTGVTVSVLSGATNAAMIINSKGSGLIELGPTGSGQVRFSVSGGLVARIDGSKIGVISTHLIGFSSSSSDPNVTDTAFARNAAKVIEINNGTAGSWGSLKAGVNDAGTTTVVTGLTLGHQSSGTPAALFGIQLLFNLNSSTTADQNAAALYAAWKVATHATRESYAGIQAISGLQTLIDRDIIGASKVLANNTGTAIVNCTLASNTVIGGFVDYVVEVFDGTNLQIESGSFAYQVTNKGGTIANNTITFAGASGVGVTSNYPKNVTTSGTLVCTWTITAANPAVLTLNANSSLTPSTGYPRVTYSLRNLTQQAVAVQ